MVFKVRHFVLLFFLLVNTFAFIYFLLGGQPTRSFDKVVHSDQIYLVTYAITILSLFFVYALCYKFAFKLRITNRSVSVQYSSFQFKFLSIILIVIMLVSLVTNLKSGVAAGGDDSEISGGGFGLVMAISQIQFLVPIFLTFYVFQKNTLYFIVFLTYIISNLLLGWTSFVIVLVFMSFYYFEVTGRVKWLKVFAYCAVLFVAYPVIYFLRFITRVSASTDLALGDVEFLNVVGQGATILDFVFFSYYQLIERLQQFYLNLATVMYYEEILYHFSTNSIYPYYFEGFHRNVLGGKFYPEATPLGNFLPNIYHAELANKDFFWNVSPGFHAWMFNANVSSVFYVFYIVFLVSFSSFLLKLIKANSLCYSLFFIYTIILLFHGWMAQYFNFVWSLLLFSMLNFIFSFINNKAR